VSGTDGPRAEEGRRGGGGLRLSGGEAELLDAVPHLVAVDSE
jgi:hypothetical protein